VAPSNWGCLRLKAHAPQDRSGHGDESICPVLSCRQIRGGQIVIITAICIAQNRLRATNALSGSCYTCITITHILYKNGKNTQNEENANDLFSF